MNTVAEYRIACSFNTTREGGKGFVCIGASKSPQSHSETKCGPSRVQDKKKIDNGYGYGDGCGDWGAYSITH